MLAKRLDAQPVFAVEPAGRSALILGDILGMVTHYHVLINQLTFARQSFFPRLEMASIVRDMNESLAATGGLVNVMDVQCRTLLHTACL